MGLRRAEDDRFFALVDHLHEGADAVGLALADLDDAVEILFLVAASFLDLALNNVVVRGVGVVVEGRGELLDAEWGQIAVVDAVLQRVGVNGLAEIAVGVGVDGALGRGGQTELHGRGEVLQDAAPVGFVVGAAAVALVDDDEIEEVRRVVAEIGDRLALGVGAGHEGLEDREEDGGVFRDAAGFGAQACRGGMGHQRFAAVALLAVVHAADFVGRDAQERVGREGGEREVGLIGEDVAVGQKEDARAAGRLAREVPAGLEELQAIWKAIAVLPVPVASVRRMRVSPRAMASSALLTALCW